MAAPTNYHDASRWTGDAHLIEAKVLAIAMALGAIGFLVIGAMIFG